MKCRINLMWFLTMIVVVGISNGQPGMLYERWDTAGTPDPLLTDTSTPDYSEIVSLAQWGYQDDDDLYSDYVGRLTGWIVPPVTGNYTFWILTDDNSRLWLSTDADPANAVEIARETEWLGEDAWATAPEETVSAPIPLVGGNIYWIRGAYQEGGGGDHIRIGWASTEAGIADHTLIGDPYIWLTIPSKAYDPSPADGEFFQYSTDAAELQWTLPPSRYDPNNEGPGVSCDVLFFTEDPATGAEGQLLVNHLDGAAESVALNGLADTQAHYWWRVDSYDPNGDEMMMTEGNVWTFSSARDVEMVFIDETDGSTAISEVDPAATDDYVISLSMDPGVSVEVTVTEVAGPEPDAADIEFVGVTSTIFVLDSSNWDTGVTVTIAVVDDDELETDPESVTLTSATSSTDSAWTGLAVPDVIVSVGENECGAWSFNAYDFNSDCYVNLGDLALLVADWLTCTKPNFSDCITDYKPIVITPK